MPRELERIISKLESDGAKTLEFFEGLDEPDWGQQVYTTGSKWQVRHILAHLVSAELGFARVVADIIAGGAGAPRDMDIDDFNEEEVPTYERTEPRNLVRAYRDARSATLGLSRKMKMEDLDRQGYHPWFGEVELRSMLKLVYRHNMIHLRDVRKALSTHRPVPHREVTPPSETAGDV